MIHGLKHFREYFKSHAENFILVGGVASYLILDDVGAKKLRATKDLDIVLMMKPTAEFLLALKEYIKLGGYEIQKGDRTEATFYRFQKPQNNEFPVMIELFMAANDDLKLFDEQHIIPVSNDAGIESLSAILLDDEYFEIIKRNGVDNEGIFILNEMALIPFKAKAYLEIKERGEDSKDWKKHRSDIINLTANLLTEESEEKLTGKVRDHFVEFMKQIREELTDDIVKGACNQKIDSEIILKFLEKTFL